MIQLCNITRVGKLPNLVDRMHNVLIGFDKTGEPYFRKRRERSFITAALRRFLLLNNFSLSISVIYVKLKAYLWGGVGSLSEILSGKAE